MRKINKKGKVVLTFLFFLLATPMLAFYVAEESGVFDNRSSAAEELPPRLQFADLDGNNSIGMSDFSIWLRDYRAYKSNKATLNTRSDFDDDNAISLSDFSMWVTAFREYKSIKDASRADVLTVAAKGECRDFELQGEIKDDGGAEILARGFIYSSTITAPGLDDVSAGNAIKVNVASDAQFKKSLGTAQLAISTKYYYRAFVRNTVGYSFGPVKEFTTTLPVAETKDFEISEGLNVTMAGRAHGCGIEVKDKGFVYSTSKSKDAGLRLGGDYVKSISAGEGPASNYSAEARSLAQGKTFYYRAYAINKNDVVSYGEIDQFRTETIYATTFDADGIQEKKATLNGRVNGSDPDIIAVRGFVYSPSNSNPDTLKVGGGQVTNVEVAGKRGEYSLLLENLIRGRKYYFRAYVKDVNNRRFYGEVKSFTTKSLVALTTKVADSITGNKADLNGFVGASASTIKRIGFVYSPINTTPTLSGNNVTVKNVCVGQGCSDISGTTVEATIWSLTSGTKYYFRIFGQNDDGTSYGAVKNFTTN